MHIEIRSRFPALAASMATRLGQNDGWEVGVTATPVESCELRCSPAVEPTILADLLAALRPIDLTYTRVPELAADHIELDIGDRAELGSWNVVVHGEEPFASAVAEGMKAAGFARAHVSKEKFVFSDRMLYGGASVLARQAVAWELRHRGCFPELIKKWDDTDHDIFLYVVSPAHRGVPARRVLPVSVVTDAGDSAATIVEAISAAGFGVVQPRIADTSASISNVGVDPGPLESAEDEVGIGLLLGIAQHFADEAGIDPTAFPVRRLPPNEDQPTLYLPFHAIRSGTLAPYAGPHPSRYKLRLRTDDRAAGLTLTRVFADRGFRQVEKLAIHDFSQGFVIFYGPASSEPQVVEIVRDTLEREMVKRGILSYPISFLPGSDSDAIEVLAPFRACRDGTLLRELANPQRFSLFVAGPEPIVEDVGAYASELGFGSIEIRRSEAPSESAGRIEYGGAPQELINRLRDGIAERFGNKLFLR